MQVVLAEVKFPPFTKGKKQLEKLDVDWSRKLSQVHVERVIGACSKTYYKLLFYKELFLLH